MKDTDIISTVIEILTTIQEIRPLIWARQARYTFSRVTPVVKNPTNRIINPRAPIIPATITNVVCRVSSLNKMSILIIIHY